jgi:hypothetical protein
MPVWRITIPTKKLAGIFVSPKLGDDKKALPD